MVRKVSYIPSRLLRGKDGETRIIREVVEKPLSLDDVLGPIRKDIEWIKKRRPETQFVGGVGATGTYHRVTDSVARFQPSSFNPGINIIGVASSVATTIWLPSRLEPNHLIAIKDELGVGASAPITVRVAT